jgi:exodeoxyribonuclease-3
MRRLMRSSLQTGTFSMAKIITFNANGIRSAARKGFFDWLEKQKADVVCIQETKAQEHQLEEEMFRPAGYHCHYFDAQKKGYSGTAIFCRKEPKKISRGFGWADGDAEGRWIQADFDTVSVVSLYMPSGSSGDERQKHKYAFMDAIWPHFDKLRKAKRDFIICADWNICHKEIDLKNWRSNQKNSGFLPEERKWLGEVYDKLGYSDAFRLINQEAEQYTWWSNRGAAYEKNVGWRLDYQLITPGLKDKVRTASIYKDEKFSDHAPLIMTYELTL